MEYGEANSPIIIGMIGRIDMKIGDIGIAIDSLGEIDLGVEGIAYGNKNCSHPRDLLRACRILRGLILRRVADGRPVWAICEDHTLAILSRLARQTGGRIEGNLVRW